MISTTKCGVVSTRLGGGTSAAAALNHTFLIVLVSLVIAAVLILCVARRTYPRDIATAMAAELLTTSVAVPTGQGGQPANLCWSRTQACDGLHVTQLT
jgi:hypothetical protein